MREIKVSDFIVRFDDSQQTKDAVFEAILAWFIEQEAFNGETICQCDDPIIEAPYLLAEIADDIFKFEVLDEEDSLG